MMKLEYRHFVNRPDGPAEFPITSPRSGTLLYEADASMFVETALVELTEGNHKGVYRVFDTTVFPQWRPADDRNDAVYHHDPNGFRGLLVVRLSPVPGL